MVMAQDLADLIHRLQAEIWGEFRVVFHSIAAIRGKFSTYCHRYIIR